MADRESKLKSPMRRSRQSPPNEPLAVVGIGVCAASLESLLTLFSGLSDGLQTSYVVGVRQQDGLTVDMVLKSLATRTEMPVVRAQTGDKLIAGTIHVGGGSELITLTDGHIRIRPPAKGSAAFRGTIDSLLISLAEHAQDRSVAVILSGLGSDGTAGVSATKQFGGLSIAESLNGEDHAAEQGAASPAGIVDLLLPIEQIAAQIELYVRGVEQLGVAVAPDEISDQIARVLTEIAGTLRTVTGNDFHGYKRNTFLRRVQRRMQVVQAPDIEVYAKRLKKDRDEVQHLFQDLLIGVTQFFRDPKEFEALQHEIPKLFEGKGAHDQVRFWVLGCATG